VTLKEFRARVARERAKLAQTAGSTMRSWDDNPVAKIVGGYAARETGKNIGYVRAAKGFAQDAAFVGRLANPLDVAAKRQLGRGVVSAHASNARNTARAVLDPVGAFREVARSVKQKHGELDPTATPMARTFEGEIRRNLRIGANQGELAAEVGTLPAGGPGLRAARIARRIARPLTKADYLAMGYTRKQAAYLAERYDGAGHHSLISAESIRNTKNPLLRAAKRAIGESPLGTVRGEGMTKGEFFRKHYGLDPKYRGGQVRGGGGWSGSKLGWTRYDAFGRLWHGTPGPLKDVIWTSGTLPVALARYSDDDDQG
jgi:hypothetical protein